MWLILSKLTIKTTHVDIWQNQYNIVKLKNKIKLKKKEQNTTKMHHNSSIYITERKKKRKKLSLSILNWVM